MTLFDADDSSLRIDPHCHGLISQILPSLPACEICGEDIADQFAMGSRRCIATRCRCAAATDARTPF